MPMVAGAEEEKGERMKACRIAGCGNEARTGPFCDSCTKRINENKAKHEARRAEQERARLDAENKCGGNVSFTGTGVKSREELEDQLREQKNIVEDLEGELQVCISIRNQLGLVINEQRNTISRLEQENQVLRNKNNELTQKSEIKKWSENQNATE